MTIVRIYVSVKCQVNIQEGDIIEWIIDNNSNTDI